MENKNNLRQFLLFLGFGITPFCLAAQLVLQVVGIPASTPPDAVLYVAGSMNDWNPMHDNYRLQKDLKGNYVIELALQPGTFEFKFTRGGWKTVEIDGTSSSMPNRKIEYRGGRKVETITIQGWEDFDKVVEPDKHLLDGSWVRYKYSHGGEVRLEFFDGKVKWKWLDNSNPDEEARDAKLSDEEKLDTIAYRSEKIGEQIYIINWYHEPSGTYITLSFNFKEKQMCGSGILGAKSEETSTIFDKAIIEAFNLVEN